MSESEKDCYDEKMKIVYVRNFPIDKYFDQKDVEDSLDYMPEDDDIIICSYPKTGTTWMQYIVWKILHKNEKLPPLCDMMLKHIPFMELCGTEPIKSLVSPRVYKHHLPYNLIKINEKAKYIYTYRNPADIAVSWYYYQKNVVNLSVDFDYFFEAFLAGKVCHGDYFDHVSHYYQHKDDPHLLIVAYEDLQRNKKEQVLKVAKFLGENHYQDLIKDDIALQQILIETEFSYMKQNIDTSGLLENMSWINEESEKKIPMFRKGIVGDGKNLLTPKQINKLKEKMLEKIKNTELINFWSF